jgi:hypothetical protein
MTVDVTRRRWRPDAKREGPLAHRADMLTLLRAVLEAAQGSVTFAALARVIARRFDLDAMPVTAAHSVWLTPVGTTNLADVLEDWVLLNGRRAGLTIHVVGPAATGSQAGAAVLRILHEYVPACPSADTRLRASLTPGTLAHEIRLTSHSEWPTGPANVPVIARRPTRCDSSPRTRSTAPWTSIQSAAILVS